MDVFKVGAFEKVVWIDAAGIVTSMTNMQRVRIFAVLDQPRKPIRKHVELPDAEKWSLKLLSGHCSDPIPAIIWSTFLDLLIEPLKLFSAWVSKRNRPWVWHIPVYQGVTNLTIEKAI